MEHNSEYKQKAITLYRQILQDYENRPETELINQLTMLISMLMIDVANLQIRITELEKPIILHDKN